MGCNNWGGKGDGSFLSLLRSDPMVRAVPLPRVYCLTEVGRLTKESEWKDV